MDLVTASPHGRPVRSGFLAAGLASLAVIFMAACSGGGGGGSAPPVPAPEATSLTASSDTPLRGAPFHLTPVYSNGTGAISYTGGTVTCPATGQDSADLTANWTGARVYTLTVTNSANVAATTTATVTPQAVVVGAISPGTPTILVNGTQTFTATVTGGYLGTVTWSASAGAINATTGAFTAPATPGSVTITATSVDDPAQVSTTTATIATAATASLTASTSTPLRGAPNVTITPTFSGGTAVVGTSAGASNVSASPVSGVPIGVQTSGFTTAQTYYLRVTDAFNVQHDTTVTITPQTVAVANLAPAAPNVTVGGSMTFSTTVSGGYLGTVTWSVAAGTNAGAGTINATSGVWTAPATTGTVVITGRSVDDTSKFKTTTALVVATPTASLAASSTSPLYRATDTTLTPTFAGGTAVVGTTAGASNISASATTGVAIPVETGGIIAAKTYYLRVTNAAGDHQDASVTVTPQTVSVGAVSPAAPDIASSGSVTFSASATGGALGTVAWSVTAGTNAGPGTIDASTGAYTAPATGGTVIVTATSNDDNTKTASTTATVVAAPSITSFKISQGTFTGGTTGAAANAVFAGGTGTITGGGIGAGGLAITSGSPVAITPAPDVTTTYTLTVHSSAAGSVDATRTAKALVGTLVDLAGTPSGMGNIDGVVAAGTGTKARFWAPNGLVFDGSGNLYVSDYENNCIRMIDAAGNVTTPYGSTAGLHGITDAHGNNARFFGPAGIVFDGTYFWVADAWSFTIRRIFAAPDGAVDTIAGTPGVLGSADAIGAGGNTRNRSTFGFAWSGAGSTPANIPPGLALIGTDLYIADTLNHTIRMLDTTSGTVTTPYGTAGAPGSDDTGTGTFNYPTGLAAIGTTLYVAEYGSGNIREIDTVGNTVTTLGSGYNHPVGLATDSTLLYVAEYDGCKITTLTTTGIPGLLAGSNGLAGSTDADGTSARFAYPTALAVDGGGDVLVADFGNNTVRRIAAAAPNAVTTYAGIAGNPGYSNTGTILFNNPTGLAVDSANGIVYVADTSNRAVRSINLTSGAVATLVKNGVGSTAATFLPTAVTVDGNGVVYVADGQNNLLYSISGNTLVPVSTGGTVLSYPTGLAVDPTGATLYVSDSNNGKVYMVTGGVATELGAGAYLYPAGLALSPDGALLYVADGSRKVVYSQSLIGTVAPVVLAGSGSPGYADGTGAAAMFGAVQGLAIDLDGNLYVADSDNNVLRKITPAGVVTTFCGVNGTMTNVTASGLPIALPAYVARPQAVAVVPTLDAGEKKIFIAIADAVLTINF